MAYPSEENCWSTETYCLAEVPDKVDLPTLVRVTEGIYTTQDCTTFSQGDIIRIDGCETVEMVGVVLAHLKDGCLQPHSNELYMPLNYKGRVRMCSVHGSCQRYNSVEELITYFPKFVKINESLLFTDKKGQTCSLQANDTIELLKLIGNKHSGATELCVLQNNTEIILPRTLNGLFVNVDFIVSDIMKFRMPQYIKFHGQDINLFTSDNLKEAVDNIDNYDGYLILSGSRRSRTVLFGHYKPLEIGPSAMFCRRSAVVLPMDNHITANIPVQIPKYMDIDDYEVFVLKHFSESNVSQSVEGLLYIEFSNNPGVTFLKNPSTSPPVVPPRSDHSFGQMGSQAPPRPPKPGEHSRHQLQCKPARINLKSSVQLPHCPTHAVVPVQQGGDGEGSVVTSAVRTGPARKGAVEKAKYAFSGLIGEVFHLSSVANNKTVDQELEDSDSPVTHHNYAAMLKKTKGIIHNIKKKLVPKPHEDIKEEESTPEGACSGHVYDYVDENSLISNYARQQLKKNKFGAQDIKEDTKAKTAVVRPFQQVDEQTLESCFKSLSVDELHACFLRCALTDLAQIVKAKRLDGERFSCLSDADLKQEPMFLNNLDIVKVMKIKKGWRPNVK